MKHIQFTHVCFDCKVEKKKGKHNHLLRYYERLRKKWSKIEN